MNAENQTAYIVYNDNMVEIAIDADIIHVNGEAVTIDTPSQLLDGRTMIPLRAVAEGLGLSVNFDNATRTITITEN